MGVGVPVGGGVGGGGRKGHRPTAPPSGHCPLSSKVLGIGGSWGVWGGVGEGEEEKEATGLILME
jgi:hypothetical protein